MRQWGNEALLSLPHSPIASLPHCKEQSVACPLRRSRRPVWRTSSLASRRFVTSTATAACSPIRDTTSTTWPTPSAACRSRSAATCCGTGGSRTARSSATCRRSWRPRGRCPRPIIRAMRSLPKVGGMDALRTLTSMLGHYDAEAEASSPAANYRKAVRLTGQIGSVVATWGRLAGGRRADRSGSGAGPRGELPVHAHRTAAVGAGGARVRRLARAARRSRAERLDICRARGGGDADRHSLGDRRRRSARSRARSTAAPMPT